MDLIQAVVLGLIQGLTEWLPISSTAHLRIIPEFLSWPDPGAAFTAAIQLGTIVAVLIYFWKDLIKIASCWLKGMYSSKERAEPEYRIGWGMAIGTVPIVIFGLLFKDSIESEFRSLWIIAWALIGMGVLLLLADLIGVKRRTFEQTTLWDGIWVGLWQAVALIPGSSRSGSTMTGALFAGLDRETAARFSFVLSVPSIIGAGVLSLASHRKELLGAELMPMLVANVVSLIAGYASIKFFMAFIKRHGAWMFVLYRIVLGTVLLVLLSQGTIQAEPRFESTTELGARR